MLRKEDINFCFERAWRWVIMILFHAIIFSFIVFDSCNFCLLSVFALVCACIIHKFAFPNHVSKLNRCLAFDLALRPFRFDRKRLWEWTRLSLSLSSKASSLRYFHFGSKIGFDENVSNFNSILENPTFYPGFAYKNCFFLLFPRTTAFLRNGSGLRNSIWTGSMVCFQCNGNDISQWGS